MGLRLNREYIKPKTVNQIVKFSGVGLHSKLVNISILPSNPNTEYFKRIDLKDKNIVIPNFSNVNSTSLNTTV